MSKFNLKSSGTKTVNLAGGEAYSQSPQLELVSILLTSFANDKFYRTSDEEFKKLRELIKLNDKLFVAKAAIYARTQFGMRSITHVLASELAKHISGEDWAKNFYKNIVYRPDDITEILSYHKANNGKITNAMKKGLAMSFDKFGDYSIAKYRGDGKELKLVDAVNLLHPIPTEQNADALKQLVNGTLRSFDTWETELTKAGQEASSEEEKDELKKEAWASLIESGKIGYFALLRNLRNIIEQSPESLGKALEILVDEKRIKNSLVLPFRFLTAYNEIKKLSGGGAVRALMSISDAIDISLSNVPVFKGETLVVLDTSYSMVGKPSEIGSMFAAALVKSNRCDFMSFSNDAHYQTLNPKDSTLTIANSIHFAAGGTNFHSIFQRVHKKYDRIIILSDMQGWIGYTSPKAYFNSYKSATGANPYVYSFDLMGYGTMQFPESNVFCIAGFSEKIFDIMALLETDKKALINSIDSIEL